MNDENEHPLPDLSRLNRAPVTGPFWQYWLGWSVVQFIGILLVYGDAKAWWIAVLIGAVCAAGHRSMVVEKQAKRRL